MLYALFFLVASPAFAADTFAQKCPDFTACAQAVAQLTGQKYVFASEAIKGKPVFTDNLEMTKENAELVFTQLLHDYGYTRVPMGSPNVYQIKTIREAIDATLPQFTADFTQAPELPNSGDQVTLTYRAKEGDVEDMARALRKVMPGRSRIVPHEASKTLLITDSATHLKSLYATIKDWDRKPTPEMLKRNADGDKERRRPAPPDDGERRFEARGKRPPLQRMMKGRYGDPNVNPGTVPPPEVRE